LSARKPIKHIIKEHNYCKHEWETSKSKTCISSIRDIKNYAGKPKVA
jgi:hypothetical protein